jgi:uncharacterized protein YciI
MYYILFYKTVENYVELRKPFREEHFALASEAGRRGDLLLGGALEDPVDQAVLVFRGDDPSAALNFARNDPYVRNGLVLEWQVRPWTVVVGSLYSGVNPGPRFIP